MGNWCVVSIGMHCHLHHGKALTEFQNAAFGVQVRWLGPMEEVDVETRRHRQFNGADGAEKMLRYFKLFLV